MDVHCGMPAIEGDEAGKCLALDCLERAGGWVAEPKCDGVWSLVEIATDGAVTMTTRIRPWRMRAWLAWRLLTARFTRETS